MENKTIEFVRGFNSQLENMNQYCNLEYTNNGFTEAIKLPQIFLFDDDNTDKHYVEETSLSRLVKILSQVLEVAEEQLEEKVDEFFAEKKKQATEKFSNIKIHFTKQNNLKYTTFVSGSYNEDIMEQFLDVVKEDFQYIFEGLTLDVEI